MVVKTASRRRAYDSKFYGITIFALTDSEVRKWHATYRAKRSPRWWKFFPQAPLRRQTKSIQEENIIEETKKKKAKRNRPYSYSFRVSETEKETIERKIKLSGQSKTDYLIRALADKPIIYIDNGNEILAELKRQGNNLNQVVKNNYFGRATQDELLGAIKECKSLYKKLSDMLGGG